MMLITLALLCSLVVRVSSDACAPPPPGPSKSCKCLPTLPEVATCSNGGFVGTVALNAGNPVCVNSVGDVLCDNGGVGTPGNSPAFCCTVPPAAGPQPCDGTTPGTARVDGFSVTFGPLKCHGFTNGVVRFDSITTTPAFPAGSPFSAAINDGLPQSLGNTVPAFATGAKFGNNKIVVSNTNGCSVTGNPILLFLDGPTIVTLATPTSQSPPLSAPGFVNQLCANSFGAILLASAAGGSPPYKYSINGGTSYQDSTFFDNLAPGAYSVIAKDTDGCESVPQTVTIAAASPFTSLSAPSVPAVCGPTSGSGASLLSTTTLAAVGGVAPLQYSVDNGAFQLSPVFNLAPGPHKAVFRDANGCSAELAFNVAATPDLTQTPTISPNPLPCSGSFVTLTVLSAGNTVQIDGAAPVANNKYRGPSHLVTITNAPCAKNFTVSVPLGSGGACDDNIVATPGDRCIDQFCTGGCPTVPRTCPVGKIGIQLEDNLLLCADTKLFFGGLTRQLTNWAFFDGSNAPAVDPAARISLTELNDVFSGNFSARISATTKSFSKTNGATIKFDVPNCNVHFEKVDRKRIVAPPLFDSLTLGGKPV